jgi:hypothetical protein
LEIAKTDATGQPATRAAQAFRTLSDESAPSTSYIATKPATTANTPAPITCSKARSPAVKVPPQPPNLPTNLVPKSNTPSLARALVPAAPRLVSTLRLRQQLPP